MHPALHNTLIPNREAEVIPGMMWPVRNVGNPRLVMLHACMDIILQPSRRVMEIGLTVRCLF